MLDFLRRIAGKADAYATGKALEQWYRVAELATMSYVYKLWDVGRNPTGETFALCIWLYLFCNNPSDPEVLSFRAQHEVKIEEEALHLLDNDEPFRGVIASTAWIALAICRGYDDRKRFDRILASEVFKRYCTTYPMLPPEKYALLVESWARRYSPPPVASSHDTVGI
jgi:hypothetical protein